MSCLSCALTYTDMCCLCSICFTMYTAVAARQAKKVKRKHVNKWSTPSTATFDGTAAAAAASNAALLLSKNAYMSANGVLRPLGSSSKKRKAQCECGATSRLYQ
eukprot:3286-Heterococcus_DN1.PRE.1